MNTTETVVTRNITAVDIAMAAEDITFAVREVKRTLERIQWDANKAIESISKGERFVGMGASGPLGHQAPFDLAVASANVQAKINMAIVLGVGQEAIEAAYAAGAK